MEDVQCQAEATHLVLNWTLPPGDVSSCVVLAEKLAARGDAQLVFQFNTSKDALLLPGLAPASSYRLSLIVLGRNGLQSRVVTLVCTTSAEGRHPPWPSRPLCSHSCPPSLPALILATCGSYCHLIPVLAWSPEVLIAWSPDVHLLGTGRGSGGPFSLMDRPPISSFAPPDWHPPELAAAPQMEPEMGMGVVIAWDMFGKEDGRIQWFGIVTTTNMSCEQLGKGRSPGMGPEQEGAPRMSLRLSLREHPGEGPGPVCWVEKSWPHHPSCSAPTSFFASGSAFPGSHQPHVVRPLLWRM